MLNFDVFEGGRQLTPPKAPKLESIPGGLAGVFNDEFEKVLMNKDMKESVYQLGLDLNNPADKSLLKDIYEMVLDHYTPSDEELINSFGEGRLSLVKKVFEVLTEWHNNLPPLPPAGEAAMQIPAEKPVDVGSELLSEEEEERHWEQAA